MATDARWVLLAYRLPRDPSTPRTALWRRLRRLGAAQLLDGLATLPHDDTTREQLEWLAQEVVEAGGEATVWLAGTAAGIDSEAIEQRLRDAVAREYRELTEQVERRTGAPVDEQRREAAKLRREFQRIRRRDYFRVPERAAAQAALKDLDRRAQERLAS